MCLSLNGNNCIKSCFAEVLVHDRGFKAGLVGFVNTLIRSSRLDLGMTFLFPFCLQVHLGISDSDF